MDTGTSPMCNNKGESKSYLQQSMAPAKKSHYFEGSYDASPSKPRNTVAHGSAVEAAECDECVRRWDAEKIERDEHRKIKLSGKHREEASDKKAETKAFRLRGFRSRKKQTPQVKIKYAMKARNKTGTNFPRQIKKRNKLLEQLMPDQEAELMKAGIEPNPGYMRARFTRKQMLDLSKSAQARRQRAVQATLPASWDANDDNEALMPGNYAEASAAAAAASPAGAALHANVVSTPQQEKKPTISVTRTMKLATAEAGPPDKPAEEPKEKEPEPVLDGEHVDEDDLKHYIASLSGDPTSYVAGPTIAAGDKAVRLPSYSASVKSAGRLITIKEFSYVAPDYKFLPSFVCRLMFLARMHDTKIKNWKMVIGVLANWRYVAFATLFLSSFFACMYWLLWLAVVIPASDLLTIIGRNEYFWKRRTVVYCPTILASLCMMYSLDADTEAIQSTIRQRLRSEAPALPLDGKIVTQICDDTERLARWYIARRGRGNGQERSSGWLLQQLQPSCPDDAEGSCDDGLEEPSERIEDRWTASMPMDTSSSNLASKSYNQAYKQVKNSFRSLERFLTDRGISADCLKVIPKHLHQFQRTAMTLRTSSKACSKGSSVIPQKSPIASSPSSASSSEDGSSPPASHLLPECPTSSPGLLEPLIPKDASRSSDGQPKRTTIADLQDGSADE